MSEEFCDGVKILLKRMESNPEEFTQSHKWDDFVRMGGHPDWDYALTGAEIDALKDAMRKICSKVFTERVMAKLLEGKEEETQLSESSFADALQNAYNPYKNAYPYPRPSAFAQSHPPGTFVEQKRLAQAAKNLGLIGALKEKFKNL